MRLIDVLKDDKSVVSTSRGRRLILQGTITVNNEITTDMDTEVKDGDIVEFNNIKLIVKESK